MFTKGFSRIWTMAFAVVFALCIALPANVSAQIIGLGFGLGGRSTTRSYDYQQPPPQNQGNDESLLGRDGRLDIAVTPMLKFTPVEGSLGALFGLQAAARVTSELRVGLGTYATLDHPDVTIGYTGIVADYTVKQSALFHWGGSLLVGAGAAHVGGSSFNVAGILNNIGNLINADHLVIEPSLYGEVNFSPKMSLSLGASYRYVALYSALQAEYTGFSNQGLSGYSINIGLKFR